NRNECFVIPSGSRRLRSPHGGIPALSRRRAECFTANAQGVSASAHRFPRRKEDTLEKVYSRRFPRLSFRIDETRADAFVRAAAILSATHVLSISRSAETAET